MVSLGPWFRACASRCSFLLSAASTTGYPDLGVASLTDSATYNAVVVVIQLVRRVAVCTKYALARLDVYRTRHRLGERFRMGFCRLWRGGPESLHMKE